MRTGLAEAVKDVHGLLIRSGAKVTRKVIQAAKVMKVIGRAGVGVDNVDLDAATEHGIVVMNTPSGNTIAAAEHTWGLLLALARKIPAANRSFREGKWERNNFVGSELNGKTIGVVGLGRIGAEVSRYAQAFRMKVIAHDPFISADRAKSLDIALVSLEELFEKADVITLHSPVTDQTRNMVNADLIGRMKSSAVLVNCARGALVDEAALEKALAEKKIAGAAVDVFSKEPPEDFGLVKLDNVVATPHLGASTHEAQINVGVQVAHQLTAALTQNVYDNTVNLPISDFGAVGAFRRLHRAHRADRSVPGQVRERGHARGVDQLRRVLRRGPAAAQTHPAERYPYPCHRRQCQFCQCRLTWPVSAE